MVVFPYVIVGVGTSLSLRLLGATNATSVWLLTWACVKYQKYILIDKIIT